VSTADRERAEELAHGGIASRDGDMVTLGDGVQWWLNGTQWARDEADALITEDAPRVAEMRRLDRVRRQAAVVSQHVAAGRVYVTTPPLFVLGELRMERGQRA
jgi:hypothetical protein